MHFSVRLPKKEIYQKAIHVGALRVKTHWVKYFLQNGLSLMNLHVLTIRIAWQTWLISYECSCSFTSKCQHVYPLMSTAPAKPFYQGLRLHFKRWSDGDPALGHWWRKLYWRDVFLLHSDTWIHSSWLMVIVQVHYMRVQAWERTMFVIICKWKSKPDECCGEYTK